MSYCLSNHKHRIYKYGDATKDNYANALRSYQAYLDEVKSEQRDKAADRYRYYESIPLYVRFVELHPRILLRR